jgi:hypothetical protein
VIDGFYKYKPESEMVKKINTIRIGQSRPDLEGPPILTEGDVLFSSAASASDEPRSCYNCQFFNYEKSCRLMGKAVEIHKFTWPKERRDNAKPIEFWPVCGYWIKGEPNYGPEEFIAEISPDDAGLGWVNAPETGQELGGTSCGGRNGGDDCDLWLIDSASGDKRAEEIGFCRVLQKETGNMDCCSCWQDDDFLTWQMVQERFRESKP